MNFSSLKRLASDHRSLHTSGLPPHYLFPQSDSSSSLPDDLTQLTVLLTGQQGTPYSQGLWRLHLKIPEDYPRSPPKAAFRTRIWHPNVEESTGSVCVDTLKRDWDTKLTLRDVLVTISCLLIQPNPDSALNAAAGQLLQDDYESFSRQAKLMTSIHAAIPKELKSIVTEAKRRGEEAGTEVREDGEEKRPSIRKAAGSSIVVMKKRPHSAQVAGSRRDSTSSVDSTRNLQVKLSQPSSNAQLVRNQDDAEASDDEYDEATASKENDPLQSPSPVISAPPSPRKHILGKRPLSEMPTPVDPDANDDAKHGSDCLKSSEQNILSSAQESYFPSDAITIPRKSPKLSERSKDVNVSGRLREDISDRGVITPFSDTHSPGETPAQTSKNTSALESGEGKENVTERGAGTLKPALVKKTSSTAAAIAKSSAGRNVSNSSTSSAGSGKAGKPRVGLRRL
ncbi:MAG: hypothetical protein M1827_006565 [Pycnora praestabilis]|nr:MAG: hypothetical protein M1827_006565 [Pycnora praestabilis]